MPDMSPIFPMMEPHHYSDYGFDPQIDYFQVLEEARRQTKRNEPRSIDSIHFKLSKPISKDHDRSRSKKRRWWWKSALGFLKRARGGSGGDNRRDYEGLGPATPSPARFYPYRAVAGPVYATEPVGGAGTPCRTTSRPTSGPLPYVCLRDLNVTDGHRIAASVPIYLVT